MTHCRYLPVEPALQLYDFVETSLVPFLYHPIHIPPQATKQVEATCALPRDVELHGMLSHIHQFGRHGLARLRHDLP